GSVLDWVQVGASDHLLNQWSAVCAAARGHAVTDLRAIVTAAVEGYSPLLLLGPDVSGGLADHLIASLDLRLDWAERGRENVDHFDSRKELEVRLFNLRAQGMQVNGPPY